MNSVISKEVKVLKLGRIKFKDAWKRQEEKFNSIIDTKINNRKTESNKNLPVSWPALLPILE